MKRSMFVLAIVVGVFVSGCQENATNPVSTSPASSPTKASKDAIQPITTLPIAGVVRMPGDFNSLIKVDGQVTFWFEQSRLDAKRDNGCYTLILATEAQLASKGGVSLNNTREWKVAGQSKRSVCFDVAKQFVEENYPIEDLGVDLVIHFRVTKKNVAVIGMELRKSGDTKRQ